MSKKMTVNVEWNDKRFTEAIDELAMQGLTQWAEVVKGEAQKEAPVLTGTLMRSALVEQKPSDKEIEISFNTPYALRWHEKHSSKSKYLEKPFQRLSGQANEYVQRMIRKFGF